MKQTKTSFSRRIVTGHDAAGKSVFVQTAPAPRAITSTAFPGFAMVELWSADGTKRLLLVVLTFPSQIALVDCEYEDRGSPAPEFLGS